MSWSYEVLTVAEVSDLPNSIFSRESLNLLETKNESWRSYIYKIHLN
jgi:hypothetical protein